MCFCELLSTAQKGNTSSVEEIINLFYPLVLKEAKKVYLKSYTFEDLIQLGVLNVIKAIYMFDINKNINSFSSYVFWSVKNGFGYLCRKEVRYNEICSLDFNSTEDLSLIDFLPAANNIENEVVEKSDILELNLALSKLNKEELELITFIYLGKDKRTLTSYCKEMKKDYYYATRIKKQSLDKLRNFLSSNIKIF